MDQIRAGVFDAVREVMTSGTNAPGAEFYGAVRDGVEAAMKAAAREREAPTGSPHLDPPSGPAQEAG